MYLMLEQQQQHQEEEQEQQEQQGQQEQQQEEMKLHYPEHDGLVELDDLLRSGKYTTDKYTVTRPIATTDHAQTSTIHAVFLKIDLQWVIASLGHL